jgi:hypothetical protein
MKTLAIQRRKLKKCSDFAKIHTQCKSSENLSHPTAKIKEMLVERGDGSYDSTILFLYIRQLL